jgi:NAD(P)H-dependent FMN reductase
MKKIIAFAGSNSKKSINKQLVVYTTKQLENFEVSVLDLNDFEVPLFGVDYEAAHEYPKQAARLLDLIQSADGIVLSLAEHNGAYSAVFKNIFDWMSRKDGKLWSEIPMLLMATSPGSRGGASVLGIAKNRFPRMAGNIVAEFSLPLFNENFSEGKIVNPEFNQKLDEAVSAFQESIKLVKS